MARTWKKIKNASMRYCLHVRVMMRNNLPYELEWLFLEPLHCHSMFESLEELTSLAFQQPLLWAKIFDIRTLPRFIEIVLRCFPCYFQKNRLFSFLTVLIKSYFLDRLSVWCCSDWLKNGILYSTNCSCICTSKKDLVQSSGTNMSE